MKSFSKLIIILIVLAAGYYFYAQKNKQAGEPTVENGETMDKTRETSPNETEGKPESASESPPPSLPPQGGASGSEGIFSSGEEGVMSPDVLVVQIDYDGMAYSPKNVDIKAGDIVIFKNNSSSEMWPASAPHPVHTDYPEFDSKSGVIPGGKWQFKFEKIGEWKFHDHLKPSAWGTVNVTQ